MLDRHNSARPRGSRRVLQRPVRVGVRGRHAARLARPVLHRADPRRRRGRRLLPARGRRAARDLEHLRVGRGCRRDRRQGPRGGGHRADGAGRGGARLGANGGVRRPGRRRLLRLAAEGAPGRHSRQRARRAELQQPQFPRSRGRGLVLRRRLRLGHPRCRRSAHVGARRLRRLPRAAHPGNAGEHGRDGRPGAVRGRRRQPQPDLGRPVRHAGALGRHVRRRRRRRDRRARRRAGRPRARAAVRRAVGADDGPQRPAGRHLHGQQVRAREPGPGEAPAPPPTADASPSALAAPG